MTEETLIIPSIAVNVYNCLCIYYGKCKEEQNTHYSDSLIVLMGNKCTQMYFSNIQIAPNYRLNEFESYVQPCYHNYIIRDTWKTIDDPRLKSSLLVVVW